jgi:hypothetical protein
MGCEKLGQEGSFLTGFGEYLFMDTLQHRWLTWFRVEWGWVRDLCTTDP